MRRILPLILVSLLAGWFDPSNVEHWVVIGGPLVIFALLTLCGVGLPLPEDIPLIVGGFLAAKGKMHLAVVATLAWCGIMLGDCILYHLGKRYGLNITRLPLIGRHLTKERILKAEHLFEKYGVWVVAVGRLFAGIRAAMVVAAGTIRYNFLTFFIADGLAALVSGGLFMALGYYLGRKLESIDQVVELIAKYKPWVIGGIIVLVIVGIAYLWWRHRRHKSLTDVGLEVVDPKPAETLPADN